MIDLLCGLLIDCSMDCALPHDDQLNEPGDLMNIFLSFVSDLIHCTNEMNVNIPQLADSLFERTTNTSWVVVFKSLITTHHLMVYGNEVRRSSRHEHIISARITE